MSIATQITRINTAKADIKEVVNQDFEKIQDETITYYPEKIAETIEEYKKYIPEKSYSGTEINVDDAAPLKVPMLPKGNTYQASLTGKNKLKLSAKIDKSSGLTSTINKDGSITITGTATSNGNAQIISTVNNSIPAGTYTISMDQALDTNFYLHASPDNATNWTNHSIPQGDTSNIFTSTIDYNYYNIRMGVKAGKVYNLTLYLQLEEGTTATDYEPYCGGQASPNPEYPQEIKVVTGNNVINHVGKNRIKVSAVNTSHGGLSNTLNDDNSVSISGTLTQATSNTTVAKNQIIPSGTYTFSINKTVPFNVRLRLFFEDDTNNDYIINKGNTSFTFNSLLSAKSWRIWISGLSVGQEYNETLFFQLEEGSVATEYEPYKENAYQLNLGNIELCKIGDYEDVPFKNVVGDENYNAELENGAWYKKKVFDKEILDNNTVINSVAQSTGNPDYTYVYSNILDNKVKLNANTLFMCDCFRTHTGKMIKSTQVNTDSINISNSDKDMLLRFMILTSRLTGQTNAAVKAFFNSIKPVLYYELREPVYEKITDPTLISQLEALNKFKWFKGVNHIWTETDNLEPVLEGKYKAVVESEVGE